MAPHLSAELELGREVIVREDRIQSDGHWGKPLGRGERPLCVKSKQ